MDTIFQEQPITKSKVGRKKSVNKSTIDQIDSFVAEIMSNINGHKSTVIQDFYIGCTENPSNRLFSGHKLIPYENTYMVFETPSDFIASEVVFQVCKFGAHGGLQHKKGRFVYFYKIGEKTVEWCN